MVPSFSLTTAVLLASIAGHAHANCRSLTSKQEGAVLSKEGQWQQPPLLHDMASTSSQKESVPSVLDANADRRRLQYFSNAGCETDCSSREEFCGKDQQCHTLSCENIYAHGNPEILHLGEESEDLTCVDFAPGELNRNLISGAKGLEFPAAVRFSCQPEDIETSCPYVAMNRQCVAQLDEHVYFQCYGVSPSNNNIDTYIAATTGWGNVTDNETGMVFVPHHIHYVGISGYYNPNPEPCGFVSGSFPARIPSVEFNQTLAYMHIQLTIARGTVAPIADCREEGCLDYYEFCGSDHKCHSWNCENFYNYGPVEYTGHEQDDSFGSLECEVGAPETECEWPTVLEYVCGLDEPLDFCAYDPNDPDGLAKQDRLLGNAYMSRRCVATPNKAQSFECFDTNPAVTNFYAYFDEFFESVDDVNCSADAQHLFLSSSIGNSSHIDSTIGPAGRYHPLDVDPRNARYVIQAKLEGEPPPEEAESSGTEGERPSEEAESSGTNISIMRWHSTVGGIAVTTMAVFCIL